MELSDALSDLVSQCTTSTETMTVATRLRHERDLCHKMSKVLYIVDGIIDTGKGCEPSSDLLMNYFSLRIQLVNRESRRISDKYGTPTSFDVFMFMLLAKLNFCLHEHEWRDKSYKNHQSIDDIGIDMSKITTDVRPEVFDEKILFLNLSEISYVLLSLCSRYCFDVEVSKVECLVNGLFDRVSILACAKFGDSIDEVLDVPHYVKNTEHVLNDKFYWDMYCQFRYIFGVIENMKVVRYGKVDEDIEVFQKIMSKVEDVTLVSVTKCDEEDFVVDHVDHFLPRSIPAVIRSITIPNSVETDAVEFIKKFNRVEELFAHSVVRRVFEEYCLMFTVEQRFHMNFYDIFKTDYNVTDTFEYPVIVYVPLTGNYGVVSQPDKSLVVQDIPCFSSIYGAFACLCQVFKDGSHRYKPVHEQIDFFSDFL